MRKKTSTLSVMLHALIPALLIAFVITIGLGYLFGYKAILVNGWSSEPYLKYQSLIVTYKCKFEDLKVGDFITFSNTGKSYVTHQIVAIDYENDQIECKGLQYNSTTQEYEHQTDSQFMQYKNVVGKVIYSNYLVGKTIYTLKGNMPILFGLLGMIVLSFIIKEMFSIEPKFA